MSLALLFIAILQTTDNSGTDWTKLRGQLQSRIQGRDLNDRSKALQDAIATHDFRAFELLEETMSWANKNRRALKEVVDPMKKELSKVREQHTQQNNERTQLFKKGVLSGNDSRRIQELNASINQLSQTMQSKKQELEANNLQLGNLDQLENSAREGFAAIMRDCPPALFENYQKALAKALNFPGDLSQNILYVDTLTKSGKKEASKILENILKEAKGSEALFKAAAKGILATNGKSAIQVFIDLLGSPNESVKQAVHESLKAATQQSFPPEKSVWQKWWNEKK